MSIPLSYVKSSAIKALGHSGDTLAVEYHSCKVFHFQGVSLEQYNAACAGKSIGSSIIKLVKSLAGVQYIKEE